MRSTRSTDTAPNNDSQNRAEDIRRRRVTRTQQRISTVSSRVTNPVIVRGSGFGTPIHRQAGTHPRRQYYVAMDNAAGSELRLPAIPMINPGWRAVSGIILILAVVAVFSLLNSPFFHVYTVDVQGLQRLNGSDLQAVLKLENLSIIEIQPDDIRASLAVSFPELTDVQVKVALPNAVTVSARERQPVLAWQMNDTTRWIDAEGYVFPARGEVENLVTINTSDEIPLAPLTTDEIAALQAMAAADPLMAAKVNQVTAGAAALPGGFGGSIPTTAGAINRKADLALLNASLLLAQKLPEGTPVVFDQVNGLGWSDPQGWQVFVGKDLENFEIKFALVQSIATSLNDQGIHPSLISVEHLNAPFYRLSGEQ